MLKSERDPGEDIGNLAEILCEQYLPRVFQYIRYWVNDTGLAEELTIKAMKKALIKFGSCCKDENKFSAGDFYAAKILKGPSHKFTH
jgi:hypothetical protein